MGSTRRSITLPRMNAHRLVIVAAALTTVVAAALATALAVFSSQGPAAGRTPDLSHASGTALAINGSVGAGQAAQYTAILPNMIKSALDGTAFHFYQARARPARRCRRGARPGGPGQDAAPPGVAGMLREH
jgi:hypothetical protein